MCVGRPQNLLGNKTHTIHGAGIFAYRNGWFLRFSCRYIHQSHGWYGFCFPAIPGSCSMFFFYFFLIILLWGITCRNDTRNRIWRVPVWEPLFHYVLLFVLPKSVGLFSLLQIGLDKSPHKEFQHTSNIPRLLTQPESAKQWLFGCPIFDVQYQDQSSWQWGWIFKMTILGRKRPFFTTIQALIAYQPKCCIKSSNTLLRNWCVKHKHTHASFHRCEHGCTKSVVDC